MTIKQIRRAALGAALACAALSSSMALADSPPDSPPKLTAEEQAYVARTNKLLESLHPQHGTVRLDAAKATLNLGQAYYFLDAADSRKVIVDG